ncbi:MAG: D-alanyl-D-alanine carboxypeptidase family protein [Ruminococcus sp.]|nr:D-alanyl-D-alanine carboxypeptidase family protein [Ruminococcus sp.]
MKKKKIITMTLAVGLSTAAVMNNSVKNIVSSITDTTIVQKMGDVNNDGFVDAVDATSILIEYASLSTDGKSTFSDAEKKSADINNDGMIDAVDASNVLTYYAYASTGGQLSMEEWINTGQDTSTTVTTTTTTSTQSTTTTTTTSTQSTTITTTDTQSTTTTNTQTTTTTETTTTVTVANPVISDIRLTRYDIDIPVGGKDISYVVMYPENAPDKSEIWTTSDEKIATVDSLGYITGISEGSCTVTVQSANNPSVKAEIKVTVRKATDRAKEIKLSKYNMNLSVGGRDAAEVTLLPESVENKNLVWVSSDMGIVNVSPDGIVTGLSEGTCIVTVTSVDNPELSADINVTVGRSTGDRINEIRLSKYEMNIPVGGKDISYVTMLPESVANKDEIWTTSDEKIATVDSWGNVTGVSSGTCTITVTSVDNPEIKADIKVTVGSENSENKISEIRLSKTEMNISVGGKDISYVTMLPESVADKGEIWTTSDPKIATVDSLGNVTGVSAGTCTITVTSSNNTEVKADIKVNVAKPAHNFQQINGITYIDGILVANKSYSLPSTYDPGMDATTMTQFSLLSAAASKEGLDIYLSSGYRSYSYQSGIYNNYVSYYGKAVADTFSARAGHSEHQTGLAIDVNSADDSFTDTPESAWLAEHAHEFGFIIRYPKGKENITGYKYEPWHIRYLGVEKAADVYNSGLSLEEYLGIDSYYH